MNKDREAAVRKAAQIALELATDSRVGPDLIRDVYNSVFNALIQPYGYYDNLTATGAQILNEKSDATTTE